MLIRTAEYISEDENVHVMTIAQEDTGPHSHEFLEMAYVLRGRALHTIGDRRMTVRRGDFFIVDYGTVHGYDRIEGEPFDLINILFKPELIDKSLRDCKSFADLAGHWLIRIRSDPPERVPADRVFRDADGRVADLVLRMRREYEEKKTGYLELLRCMLVEIIVITLRAETDRGSENGLTARLRDCAEKRDFRLTLEEAADTLGFSVPYLSRKFRQETGLPFSVWLQKMRTERAARLLADTDDKTAQIAEAVGYRDPKFFAETFKKHWGMTPARFRRLHR